MRGGGIKKKGNVKSGFMAEKTNKGMNFLFTPTLIEFEKTISLPMLSRKFQTHPVPVLSFLPDYPNQGLDYQPASTYPNNKENLHTSIMPGA